MKKIIKALFLVILLFTFTGCGALSGEKNDETQYAIYKLAKESGYQGSYEEWLDSIRGENGIDGREIELFEEDMMLKWRYKGSNTSYALFDLLTLQGDPGEQIELDVQNNYLVWKYVGDKEWIKLYELNVIQGEKGEPGKDGVGIKSIEKTSTEGLVDTYTITYTDNTTSTFTITNGGGSEGVQGTPGKDGKSAYEIYCEKYPDYKKTEEEWIDDLINGRLGTNVETEKFTVTFDTNGGNEIIENQEVQFGHKAKAPVDPTKEGYIFDGWYCGDEKWSFIGYVITEDTVLTAKWISIYSTVEFVVDKEYGYCDTDKIKDLNGSTIQLPVLNYNSDYIFEGWLDVETQEMITTDNIKLNRENIVLKAVFSYEVYFYCNGNEYRDIVNVDDVYTLSQIDDGSGKNIIAWYDSNNNYLYGVGETPIFKGYQYLHALYEYKLTFVSSKGNSYVKEMNKDCWSIIGSKIEEKVEDQEKFIGWYSDLEGINQIEYYPGSFDGEDITLYEISLPETEYTVTFDSNGGDPVEPLKVSRGYDDFADELLELFKNSDEPGSHETTKENFQGTSHPNIKGVFNKKEVLEKYNWFLRYMLNDMQTTCPEEHRSHEYFIKTIAILERLVNGDTEAILDSYEGPHARTAIRNYIHRLINKCYDDDNLNYAYNFFTTDYSIQSNRNILTYTLYASNHEFADVELPIPTREGYEFAGWYNIDGEKVEKVTQECTLFAKWINYNEMFDVEFDLNGGSFEEGVELSSQMKYGSFIPTPILEGCVFEGWYNEEGKLVEQIFASGKYTANWLKYEEDLVYIKFDYAGGVASSIFNTPDEVKEAFINDLNACLGTSYTVESSFTWAGDAYKIFLDPYYGAKWAPLVQYFHDVENEQKDYIENPGKYPNAVYDFYKYWDDLLAGQDLEAVDNNAPYCVAFALQAWTKKILLETMYHFSADYSSDEVQNKVLDYFKFEQTNVVVVETGKSFLLPKVEKEGAIFIGFFDENNNYVGDIIEAKENITLTAKFGGYVIFDCNDDYYDVAERVDDFMVSEEGVQYSLPIISRPNYNFLGWFDKYGNKYEVVDSSCGLITLYAQWEGQLKSLSYVNGKNDYEELHFENIDPVYCVYGSAYGSLFEISYDGLIFDGWWTEDGTDGFWGRRLESNEIVRDNIVVYAKFNKPYTVKLNFEEALGPINHVWDAREAFLTDFYNWCLAQDAFTAEEVTKEAFIGYDGTAYTFNGLWVNYSGGAGNPSNLFEGYNPDEMKNFMLAPVFDGESGRDCSPIEYSVHFLNDIEMNAKWGPYMAQIARICGNASRVWGEGATNYFIYELARTLIADDTTFRMSYGSKGVENRNSMEIEGCDHLLYAKHNDIVEYTVYSLLENNKLPEAYMEGYIFNGWTYEGADKIYTTICEKELSGKTLTPVFNN